MTKPQSSLTKTLAVVVKKLKWAETKSVGYETAERKDKYVNPLLTPPPRSPKSPEDFRFFQRLGHWQPLGYDWTNQKADRYYHHENMFFFWVVGALFFTVWFYAPDYKLRDWARREAYLRTNKREALGLPIIDRNVIPPERMVLPSEEELGDFPVTL